MNTTMKDLVDVRDAMDDDSALIAALDALESSGRHTKIARFRRALPAIERALARKVPQKQVLDELNRSGLSLSMATFKAMLSRERQEQGSDRPLCEHCGSPIVESTPHDASAPATTEAVEVAVPIISEAAPGHYRQRSF